MSIPGVVPIWCSVSKRYQKLKQTKCLSFTPWKFNCLPLLKIPSQKDPPDRTYPKTHDFFRGDVMASNFGAKKFRRCKIGIFSNQATPWHRDNVADSWNAIPLTSVVQSHSAHLSTGQSYPRKFSIGKRRHMKNQTFLGVPKMVDTRSVSCNCLHYRLSQKQQETEWLVALNP